MKLNAYLSSCWFDLGQLSSRLADKSGQNKVVRSRANKQMNEQKFNEFFDEERAKWSAKIA